MKKEGKPKARKTDRDTPAVQATAPGQALGYSLQYTRLTAMLLTATEGSLCSLEVLDDAAEETSTGTTHLVQSKSSLGPNPVSDHAKSLWKTLFNWMALINSGTIDSTRTIFEIYVSRPVTGDIVAILNSAQSDVAAKKALKQARSILWGAAPEFPHKKQLNEDIAKYANPVLSADDKIVVPLIKNFRLVCGSGSPQSDLEAIIRSHPVSLSKVPDITNYLCGLVKREVDMLLEQSLPAIISRDTFHQKYSAYCRRIDRETILQSSVPVPTRAERLAHLPDIFVQQLGLLELDFEDQLEAVSDFLMACADRTTWAKSGEVDEASLDTLDEDLTRAWKNKRRATEVEHRGKSGIDRGLILYSQCMEHKAALQAMSPPPYFVAGCFHRLSDSQDIGWHPDYRILLSKKLEDAA